MIAALALVAAIVLVAGVVVLELDQRRRHRRWEERRARRLVAEHTLRSRADVTVLGRDGEPGLGRRRAGA